MTTNEERIANTKPGSKGGSGQGQRPPGTASEETGNEDPGSELTELEPREPVAKKTSTLP